MLDEWNCSNDNSILLMAIKMKDKFDKYWRDPKKMNFIIVFANILDPINKLEYMEFSLVQIFGQIKGGSFFASVKSALTEFIWIILHPINLLILVKVSHKVASLLK